MQIKILVPNLPLHPVGRVAQAAVCKIAWWPRANAWCDSNTGFNFSETINKKLLWQKNHYVYHKTHLAVFTSIRHASIAICAAAPHPKFSGATTTSDKQSFIDNRKPRSNSHGPKQRWKTARANLSVTTEHASKIRSRFLSTFDRSQACSDVAPTQSRGCIATTHHSTHSGSALSLNTSLLLNPRLLRLNSHATRRKDFLISALSGE